MIKVFPKSHVVGSTPNWGTIFQFARLSFGERQEWVMVPFA
jgi:hypothetical protein